MQNNKQLLVDSNMFQILNESTIKESKDRLVVKGVLQRAESRNQNNRVYSRSILERELNTYQSLINERRALGELDHPDSTIVNLANVSHNISRAWWEGDDIVGEIEVLSTPAGNILKELFKAGIKLGISSRGLGSVSEHPDGTIEVQEDFSLVAWDFVSNPSTQGAFMKPKTQLGESVDLYLQQQNKTKRINDIIYDILTQIKQK